MGITTKNRLILYALIVALLLAVVALAPIWCHSDDELSNQHCHGLIFYLTHKH